MFTTNVRVPLCASSFAQPGEFKKFEDDKSPRECRNIIINMFPSHAGDQTRQSSSATKSLISKHSSQLIIIATRASDKLRHDQRSDCVNSSQDPYLWPFISQSPRSHLPYCFRSSFRRNKCTYAHSNPDTGVFIVSNSHRKFRAHCRRKLCSLDQSEPGPYR